MTVQAATYGARAAVAPTQPYASVQEPKREHSTRSPDSRSEGTRSQEPDVQVSSERVSALGRQPSAFVSMGPVTPEQDGLTTGRLVDLEL